MTPLDHDAAVTYAVWAKHLVQEVLEGKNENPRLAMLTRQICKVIDSPEYRGRHHGSKNQYPRTP